MKFPVTYIKPIMIVSGLLTCTMAYAAVAPREALFSTLGTDLGDGPLAEILVRNWGVLVTLVGGALVYGAFHPGARALALGIATISKLGFVALVLSLGRDFLGQQAGIAVGIDALWVILFGWFLASTHPRARTGDARAAAGSGV